MDAYLPALEEILFIAAEVLGAEVAALRRLPRISLAESAIAAPRASLGGVEAYPTLAGKIAALGWHLPRNHPFPDGNKRVAVAMVVTARMNGTDLRDPGAEGNDRVMRGRSRRDEHRGARRLGVRPARLSPPGGAR